MLTKNDLKEIGRLLDPIEKSINSNTQELKSTKKELGEVKGKLDTNTASVLRVEQKIKSALELRVDVKDFRENVKDHRRRITNLERL